jgi:hypothetical protein
MPGQEQRNGGKAVGLCGSILGRSWTGGLSSIGLACNNPSSRTERAHPADHINPRHPAPAKVHQSDVGLMAEEALNGVVRITCFANDREIGLSTDRSD